MSAFHYEPGEPGELARDTIGGRPVLPPGVEWPRCACGERMAFYLQVDVPEEVARFGGAHLTVFQCPVHNEACVPCVEPGVEALPAEYLDEPPNQLAGRFWRAYLHRGEGVAASEADARLVAAPLVRAPLEEEAAYPAFLKVGGEPAWVQPPERYACACGAPMAFLAELSSDLCFAKQPDAPVQPDSLDDDAYMLFLGNTVVLLACTAGCDPRAVWPVNQN